MNPKHIVVVNVFFAPYSYGGATIVAEEIAHQLVSNHNFRVTAISAICLEDIAPYTILKVEKFGIVNYLINIPNHRSYAEIYNNPQVDDAVARLMDMLSPDLFHIHCIQDLGAGMIGTVKRRNIPVVLSVHDFWWLCERQFMITPNEVYCAQNPIEIDACKGCVSDITRAKTRFNYLREQVTRADILTCPSNFALELCKNSGLRAHKNVVWQNGVNVPSTGFFERQDKRRKLDTRISFGFVGGPSHIKGWHIIRRAFAKLKCDNFSGYLIDGSLDENWWDGVNISSMKGDWKIHPRFSQKNMDDFYAKIDVLLFMSQWKETYGLTIREATSRGIEVIQTNSGGTVEHDTVVSKNMLEIGDGPEKLVTQIERVLSKRHKHPNPFAENSYSDQAQELVKLIQPLLN